MTNSIDPRTPIVVGVGQVADRIDDVGYLGASPIDLAEAAARSAIADAGAGLAKALHVIDTLACTRQFENSTPRAEAQLGRSTKFPVSVANRIGARPSRMVLEVSGGQSPQHLVSEYCREIAGGRSDAVLLAGAEAISTIRRLAATQNPPDFSDDPADPHEAFEDRGFGLEGLTSREQVVHGLVSAPVQYALLENARRAEVGATRPDYAVAMAVLLAPFSTVAQHNPLSASQQARTPEELATITDRNRLIAEPYPRFMVSRDQVNQAAAVVLMSVGTARSLAIDPAKWVFVHGQSDLAERTLMERRNLAEAPSAVAAVKHALSVARTTVADIDFFDLYSCFPIAVSNIIDAIGLKADDPRMLTLTGGLPFFGGAGNNYSMHAIAEAAKRVRSAPGSRALVSANGGVLSKTSVGIYSATPAPHRPDDSAVLQRWLDTDVPPPHAPRPDGPAAIESYTVSYGRNAKRGIVIGRLSDGGARFLARVDDRDDETMALLEQREQPVGSRVVVRPSEAVNVVALAPKCTHRV